MRALKQREIFGYTVGDLGINLSFQMVGMYLAFFYTDVFGISQAHVAGLYLVARIWDAVNDPLMGYIADRTRSRWGRFRPYLLFGAVPLNLMLILCFYTPELSTSAKVIYAYVTYILQGMIFTAVGLPYSSISAVMTQDQQERAVMATYRMFFAVIVANSLVSIGVKPFVALFETEQRGYFVVAMLFAVTSTLLLWFAFSQSQERVEAPQEKYRLREVLPILFKNDALLALAAAMLLNTGVWVVGLAVTLYYFKYIHGGEGFVPVFFGFMLPANLLAVIWAPVLTRWIGKRRTFILGSLIVAVLLGVRYFVPGTMLLAIVLVSMVYSFGQLLCSITQWGMLPDTVEYGHWKTGIRSEGIPFAFFSLVQKVGMALGGAVPAAVLAWAGYVANQEQSESSRSAIEALFSLVPAVLSLLCLVSLLFYRLDRRLFAKITIELAERAARRAPLAEAGPDGR